MRIDFKDESSVMELLHGEKRVKHITFLATKVNKMLKYELMKAYAAELFLLLIFAKLPGRGDGFIWPNPPFFWPFFPTQETHQRYRITSHRITFFFLLYSLLKNGFSIMRSFIQVLVFSEMSFASSRKHKRGNRELRVSKLFLYLWVVVPLQTLRLS